MGKWVEAPISVEKKEAWDAVLSSPEGRRVIHDIIRATGLLEGLPRVDTQYAAGRHSIGVEIYRQIMKTHYNYFCNIIKESQEGAYDDRD